MTDAVSNVLATRYASPEMVDIWGDSNRVADERRLWVAVLAAQQELGIPVPDGAIEAYDAQVEAVDLASIRTREKTTKHDVKARIEEFDEQAGGHQQIHKGMTSRDLTDNVEQMQVRQSLELVRDRIVTTLHWLGKRALELDNLPMAARTHNVPAQITILGKRFATAAEEQINGYLRITELLVRYPLRGIKGPVGTAADQLDLLENDPAKLKRLNERVAAHLGFQEVMVSTGQVYPRSLDFDVVSALTLAISGPSNLATTIRLMAGNGLANEGFLPGQTGSSAMPHKRNARSCERVNSLAVVLRGFSAMAAELVGTQWNEGDVSDSALRRVALPDAFFATDGLYQTFLTVLQGFQPHRAAIQAELDRELPFLATTSILMAAVKKGVGRETAHEIIKEHSLATSQFLTEDPSRKNDLLERLASDGRLDLSLEELRALIANPETFTGAAKAQIAEVVAKIKEITNAHPEAAAYTPRPIL